MYNRVDDYGVSQKVTQLRESFNRFKHSVEKQINQLEYTLNEIIMLTYPREQLDQAHSICFENTTNQTTIQSNDLQTVIDSMMGMGEFDKNQTIPAFSDNLINRIVNKFKSWEKQLIPQITMSINIIPKGKVDFQFSNTNKFQSITVLTDKTITQNNSETHYCFGAAEPAFNMNEITTIYYKINKQVGDCGVGMCDLKLLTEKAFRPRLNQIASGAFICFQDKYVVHSEVSENNWTQKGFLFTTGDVIQFTFDPKEKKMTWNKLRSAEEYSVKINNTDVELYPCVVFKDKGSLIELLIDI